MLHSAWKTAFWQILPPHHVTDLWWPLAATQRMYLLLVGIRPLFGLAMLIAITGVVYLWRNGKRDIVALAGGPYIVALIVSALKIYPFSPSRVSLFLVPWLIIAFAAGIELLAQVKPQFRNAVRVALFCAFVQPQQFVLTWSAPEWLREDVPGALEHLRANRQPGDRIYAFWSAVPATFFYGPRYGVKNSDVYLGNIHEKDVTPYVEELDSLRGSRRVWLIFSHTAKPEPRDAILARMDSIGRRLDEFPDPKLHPDASVFLYDLSAAAPPEKTPP